ncbi:MAG: hypothetical protein ACI8Z1_001925 [Candidatus Azotimanducaceae bacterium]|jgi:hypothetical protein
MVSNEESLTQHCVTATPIPERSLAQPPSADMITKTIKPIMVCRNLHCPNITYLNMRTHLIADSSTILEFGGGYHPDRKQICAQSALSKSFASAFVGRAMINETTIEEKTNDAGFL